MMDRNTNKSSGTADGEGQSVTSDVTGDDANAPITSASEVESLKKTLARAGLVRRLAYVPAEKPPKQRTNQRALRERRLTKGLKEITILVPVCFHDEIKEFAAWLRTEYLNNERALSYKGQIVRLPDLSDF
jgi:hypothetical protein